MQPVELDARARLNTITHTQTHSNTHTLKIYGECGRAKGRGGVHGERKVRAVCHTCGGASGVRCRGAVAVIKGDANV